MSVAPASVIGLQTWIWRNNGRSIVLLLAFPALIAAILWSLAQAWSFIMDGAGVAAGNALFLASLPWTLVAVAVWFLIAVFIQKRAVLSLASAEVVTREQAPRLYALMEPLVISRGLPMPQLAIIPSPGRNAFATGWSPQGAVIGVTQGLLDALDDRELEAVLAHELTHVMNRDTRLLVVSIVFVGVFALAAELTMRWLAHSRPSSNDRKGGQFVLFLLLATLILWIGRIGAMALRFALSRKREYLADAGAIELTKNPDALVSALEKIAGNPDVAGVVDEVQQMFIFDPKDVWEMFSTHPTIESRVAAIRAVG
jgi:heat shock protein HtpX